MNAASKETTKPILFCVIMALVLGCSSSVFAQMTIVETESATVTVGGFVSNFTLAQDRGYDIPGISRGTASNSSLARIETNATFGESVTAELHNRFFSRFSSTANTLVLGLGSTTAPKRTVDLQSKLVDDDAFYLEHDIDRLAVSWFNPVADITIGRQAITWGNSTLFPVSDLWTQFSPFEVDTSQKRGVDGLRAISYPLEDFELEFVVVDRGEIEELSGGVRAGWSLGPGDFFGGLARNYDNYAALMGATIDVDVVRTHTELHIPFNAKDKQLTLPRWTIGADFFSGDLTVGGEYHFNGFGVTDYSTVATAGDVIERFSRGEQYLLGRHYVGLLGAYALLEELTVSAAVLLNITDPSASISPTIAYQLSGNSTVTFGAYLGIGERPSLSAPIASEFWLLGTSGFFNLSGFF